MERVVPRLDTAGITTNTLSKIDYILACVFTSDKKQSVIYDNVVSMIDVLKDVTLDPALYSKNIVNALKEPFSSYFGNENINIDATTIELADNKYQINVIIKVSDGKEVVAANKSVFIKDGLFEKIINQI